MNNVFTIPPYLVLPSDRKQIDSPCTEEEMRELDLDIQEATDKIIAVCIFQVITIGLKNTGKLSTVTLPKPFVFTLKIQFIKGYSSLTCHLGKEVTYVM